MNVDQFSIGIWRNDHEKFRKKEKEMTEVYLIDGYIDDGMQGDPFTLGIFTDFESAKKEILKFIGQDKYSELDSAYLVEGCHWPYTITITKYELNKILTPHQFESRY